MLRSHIASGACPGPGYSASTRSVFTAELTPAEFAPLAGEPEAAAAYRFMRDATFHIRAMRRG